MEADMAQASPCDGIIARDFRDRGHPWNGNGRDGAGSEAHGELSAFPRQRLTSRSSPRKGASQRSAKGPFDSRRSFRAFSMGWPAKRETLEGARAESNGGERGIRTRTARVSKWLKARYFWV
jgi:hypothetical protein